jgi:AraC family transcriptional regulator of adaptative response/methylated-DNA-[protein]-cysteine methyltransferase
LCVHISGTNFQIQVWKALLRLPSGETTSYGEVARAVGRPGAARAVGSAVGSNPVAWLIPCHRVLRSDGKLGGYHWGPRRKEAMLAWETAHSVSTPG